MGAGALIASPPLVALGATPPASEAPRSGARSWAAELGSRSGWRRTPALEIDLPQLQYPGHWNPRRAVMKEIGLELRLRTRLEPQRRPSIVTATEPDLFETPFLYVAGQGQFPTLDTRAEAQLRRFIDLGGLLVFDDADGGLDPNFRKDINTLVGRLLPGRRLEPIAPEHVLYHSFYIIEHPAGRTRHIDHNLGVADEGRLQVIFLPNDLGGALTRGVDGHHSHPCTPGGEVQREWATRLAVNILLYATCTDYKSDRAHVETLLRRRRWRSE